MASSSIVLVEELNCGTTESMSTCQIVQYYKDGLVQIERTQDYGQHIVL